VAARRAQEVDVGRGRGSGPLPWLPHACIVSAQAVIGLVVAATGDPDGPLLFFWMWCLPYAGLFGRRAMLLHVGWTAVTLAAALASSHGGERALAPGSLLMVLTTGLVLAALVHRLTVWLYQRATHDPLTGLANRALFLATHAALTRRRGEPGSVALLLLDLDRFKVVNDTYGHRAGRPPYCSRSPRASCPSSWP
jgi:hypothetical protein